MSALTILENQVLEGDPWSLILEFVENNEKYQQLPANEERKLIRELGKLQTQTSCTEGEYSVALFNRQRHIGASLLIYLVVLAVALPILLALSQALFIPFISLSLAEVVVIIGITYSYSNTLESIKSKYIDKVKEAVQLVKDKLGNTSNAQ